MILNTTRRLVTYVIQHRVDSLGSLSIWQSL
jgi:hypothetical protein